MGYTTRFRGKVAIEPPLNAAEVDVLRQFANERHEDSDLGYYCQWVPTGDGTALEWDGGEKFYEADGWMKYLVDNFIKPQHTANGTIDARGEEATDYWRLIVKDNVVTRVNAKVTWPDDGDDEIGEEDVVIEWPEEA